MTLYDLICEIEFISMGMGAEVWFCHTETNDFIKLADTEEADDLVSEVRWDSLNAYQDVSVVELNLDGFRRKVLIYIDDDEATEVYDEAEDES